MVQSSSRSAFNPAASDARAMAPLADRHGAVSADITDGGDGEGGGELRASSSSTLSSWFASFLPSSQQTPRAQSSSQPVNIPPSRSEASAAPVWASTAEHTADRVRTAEVSMDVDPAPPAQPAHGSRPSSSASLPPSHLSAVISESPPPSAPSPAAGPSATGPSSREASVPAVALSSHHLNADGLRLDKSLLTKIDQLEAENASLIADRDKKAVNLIALKKAHRLARKADKDLADQVARTHADEISHLQSERTRLAAEVAQLEDAVEDEKAARVKEVAGLTKTTGKLEKRIALCKRENAQLHAERDEQERMMTKIVQEKLDTQKTAEGDKASAEGLRAELATSKEELQTAVDEARSIKENVGAAEAKASRLEGQLEEERGRVSAMEGEAAEMGRDIRERGEEVKRLAARLQSRKRELEASEVARAHSQKQLADLSARLASRPPPPPPPPSVAHPTPPASSSSSSSKRAFPPDESEAEQPTPKKAAHSRSSVTPSARAVMDPRFAVGLTDENALVSVDFKRVWTGNLFKTKSPIARICQISATRSTEAAPVSSTIVLPSAAATSEETTTAVLVRHLETAHASNWKKICDGRVKGNPSRSGGKS